MTPPLPGDVVLWKSAPYRWSEIRVDGYDKEYRARPVAADDAVLGVVTAARAVEVATRPSEDAPDMGRCLRAEAYAALDALFRALGEVERYNG